MTREEITKLANQCGIAIYTRKEWSAQKKVFVPVEDTIEGDIAALVQYTEQVLRRAQK